ncbi:MAG: chemotaxis protein CheW [Armatimonadetes bacterium]|nr:chemotaxis protein CheW [Armatimonadota bacterium]
MEENRAVVDEEQLVALEIAGEIYGVDISLIHGIIMMQEITRIPHAPAFVEGVTNLRGRVIPVLDLRKRFGLPEAERTKENRIVIVEISDEMMGMIVDGVSEVLRISADAIEPTPPIVTGLESAYLRGVGKVDDRLIILLDVRKVLSESERQQINLDKAMAA